MRNNFKLWEHTNQNEEEIKPTKIMLNGFSTSEELKQKTLAAMAERRKENEKKQAEKAGRKRRISRQWGMAAAVAAIIVMVTPLSGCVADTVKAAYHRVCEWAEERNQDGVLTAFEGVIEENDDTVGWIKIPNTTIDYPVVQAEDNSYYISHNFQKKEETWNTLFLDSRNVIEKDKISKVTIIYGHNSNWLGSLLGREKPFTALSKYDDIKFYQENPILLFDTIYDTSDWVVFANFRATTYGTEGDYIFDYTERIDETEFTNNEEFLRFVENIRKRSLINTPIEVNADDDILLLSTVAYENKKWRMVIAARRVREGEMIDVSTAEKNANPLMPYDNPYNYKTSKD